MSSDRQIVVIMPWKPTEEVLSFEQPNMPDGVDLIGLEDGLAVQCVSDTMYNLPHLLDAIKGAEERGYGAVVLACFGDPGVETARELVNIPVLGPMNVGLHLAAMLGHKICILSPEIKNLGYIIRANVVAYGLQDRAVVRGNNSSILDVMASYSDYKSTGKVSPFIEGMVDVCVKSAEEDGSDIVVLGCGVIKWMKDVLEDELRKRGYPLTVINPLAVAVQMARGLIELKLSHSRAAYPKPTSTARDAAKSTSASAGKV